MRILAAMASQLMRSVDRVHVLRRILRTSSSSLSTSTSSTSSSSSSEPSVCRIGCASGFWGDTAVASAQLLRRTRLDYLVFDYLSEITMTLLNAAKMKKPDMGYAPDFVATLAPNLKLIKEQGVRVVSNAGGVDPEACRAALLKTAAAEGFDLDVAVVTGDDLLARKGDFVDAKSMHTGKPVSMKGLTSMNAYFGAQPIARCLKAGAEIVITGRCVDSAVALGPLIHHFDWDMHDYDRLAAGSLAGHLIECGAQSTGGIFTDHHLVPDWWNIGFPVVEVDQSGIFVITKPVGTGGLVSRETVAEQLLYEIGDPARYELPDVTCDFRHVTLEELGDQRVRVTGVRGLPPSGKLKVFVSQLDQFRLTVVAGLVGPDCAGKGRRTAEEILKRVRAILKLQGLPDFSRVHIQVLGAEETYGPSANPGAAATRDGVLWLAVQHPNKAALGVLAREIAPAGTGMAPGLTGLVGGRPKVSPMFSHDSFLVAQERVKAEISTEDGRSTVTPIDPGTAPQHPAANLETPIPRVAILSNPVRLGDLALTRSGDKENSANVGVIARLPEFYPLLKKKVTAERVGHFFRHCFPNEDPTGNVSRFELPGVYALNFVLKNSLGGGGVASLRPDPQGKGFGQMLLDLVLEPDEE